MGSSTSVTHNETDASTNLDYDIDNSVTDHSTQNYETAGRDLIGGNQNIHIEQVDANLVEHAEKLGSNALLSTQETLSKSLDLVGKVSEAAFTNTKEQFDTLAAGYRNYAGNLASNKSGGQGIGAASSGGLENFVKISVILGGLAAAYAAFYTRG